jgi:predicted RNase H-like HicB family nuclease
MESDDLHSFRIAVYRAPGGYLAIVEGVRGCFAHGASEVEAVENARGSIRTCLAMERMLTSLRAAVEVRIRP